MEIHIVWGEGEGKTTVSAFDKALAMAGIHNYNLIYLSSVIPPGSVIIESCKMGYIVGAGVGDMLRVVISRKISTKTGSWISAGLGWVQAEEGGIFIELATDSRAEECKELLIEGVADMMSVRDWNWTTEINDRVVEHGVESTSAVVVAAIYAPQKF
jgi:arginine decarboxylase